MTKRRLYTSYILIDEPDPNNENLWNLDIDITKAIAKLLKEKEAKHMSIYTEKTEKGIS